MKGRAVVAAGIRQDRPPEENAAGGMEGGTAWGRDKGSERAGSGSEATLPFTACRAHDAAPTSRLKNAPLAGAKLSPLANRQKWLSSRRESAAVPPQLAQPVTVIVVL